MDKEYTFDMQIIKNRKVGYIPLRHLTVEAEIIEELNKEGYVVSIIHKVDSYICRVTSKIDEDTTVEELQKEIDKLNS